MSVNLWDFLNYFFHEFLISVIIGYSKKKVDENEINAKAFEPKSLNINDNNEINFNFNEESNFHIK